MEYRLVYDVTQEMPAIWFPAFGLVFVAAGVLLWRYRHELTTGWRPFATRPAVRTAFAALFLGFSILWTAFSGVSVLAQHFAAQRALREGRAAVVEGVVEHFHPMPYTGHDTERFTVRGVRFAYSDYLVVSGFNRTSSHGGPIREGLPVRIHWCGSPAHATILKLEIKG